MSKFPSYDFDKIFKEIDKEFARIKNDIEKTSEDFSKRATVQKPIYFRLVRKLWIVDGSGIVTITNIDVYPPKKTLWNKLLGWFK